MIGGVVLVLAGIGVIVAPIVSTYVRGHTDDQALSDWNHGGASALAGAAPNAPAAVPGSSTAGSPAPAGCTPNAAPAQDYALVSFPSLAKYGYSGVAATGDWNTLRQRSMVHYTTSPAPGQQGNVIIGFHREPHYEHIDQLNVGDAITVQDRSCAVHTYRVTQRWTLDPGKVTQLDTTTGHDITLVTCTPWWQDYNRIVWRGTLVSSQPG
jgi:LPXTG-site transpeptidase (sortase) family protein